MKLSDMNTIRKKMVTYFENVTPEQLESDLKKADFDFYNSLDDSPVVYSPPKRIVRHKLYGELVVVDELGNSDKAIAVIKRDYDDYQNGKCDTQPYPSYFLKSDLFNV
jgi:hypothetical protein